MTFNKQIPIVSQYLPEACYRVNPVSWTKLNISSQVFNNSLKRLLVDVEVSEDELDDLVWAGKESEEQAVETRRVRPRVVGTAERATLLAERRCEPDARATWKEAEDFFTDAPTGTQRPAAIRADLGDDGTN